MQQYNAVLLTESEKRLHVNAINPTVYLSLVLARLIEHSADTVTLAAHSNTSWTDQQTDRYPL